VDYVRLWHLADNPVAPALIRWSNSGQVRASAAFGKTFSPALYATPRLTPFLRDAKRSEALAIFMEEQVLLANP
jgi:hypothetical protein